MARSTWYPQSQYQDFRQRCLLTMLTFINFLTAAIVPKASQVCSWMTLWEASPYLSNCSCSMQALHRIHQMLVQCHVSAWPTLQPSSYEACRCLESQNPAQRHTSQITPDLEPTDKTVSGVS